MLIRIYAPRGTNNAKVWDTSNRAINVIINNLKGIFFDDDNFEHMACGIFRFKHLTMVFIYNFL